MGHSGDRIANKSAPAPRKSLLEWLATLEPIDDDFPTIGELPVERDDPPNFDDFPDEPLT